MGVLAFGAFSVTLLVGSAAPVSAGTGVPELLEPPVPPIPTPGPRDQPVLGEETDNGIISIDVGGTGDDSASQSIILLVGLAVLSLAPSLVLMLSSFTRIIIVFSLTRNALGLQGIPPNQVLVGLALFLSLFVMAPTLDVLNEDALQPYLDGEITQEEAVERGTDPIREFMLVHTDPAELEVMLEAGGQERPATADDIGLSALIPAFLLSELKTAFIIGFVIFIPFLIIDIVVAASLMALGMMMLPPAFISLPFKLLLFIMVGGWSLVVETLLSTYL
ncbi:MAG: flagellar type III secretion system pore protein FliP [Actinomycetota bacterium]